MPKAEARELYPFKSPEQLVTIASDMFSTVMAKDIARVQAIRVGIDSVAKPGTLAEANPQLVGLYRELVDQGESTGDLTEMATQLYLKHRTGFLAGKTDDYGRVGLLQTVPSEIDSAAQQTLFDLIHDGDAESHGIMHRVYRAQRKDRGGFQLLDLADLLPDQEDKFIQGREVVVPASPWAGYYTAVFVPDNPREDVLVSSNSTEGNFDDYELFGALRTSLDRVASHGFQLRPADAGLFYAIRVYGEEVAPGDQRLRATLVRAARSVGFENPEGETKMILQEVGSLPLVFEPARTNSMSEIDQNLTLVREKLVKVGLDPDDGFNQALRFLVDRKVFMDDPALILQAITELTSENGYPRWVEHAYNRLSKAYADIKTAPAQELILRGHLGRYQAFGSYGGLKLPWQARHLLTDEELRDLHERLGKALPDYEPDPLRTFSLLTEVPVGILPTNVDPQGQYLRERNGQRYFDLAKLWSDYGEQVLELNQKVKAEQIKGSSLG